MLNVSFLKLKDELAIQDTAEALRLQPDNVKALFRRALAKKVSLLLLMFIYDLEEEYL